MRDLEALRLFGPDPDGLPVVAAGAPWFMTLFGRDSLLTSYMALLVDHDLALGVLETLARHQGTRIDPATEEQPGRILHEVRDGGAWISLRHRGRHPALRRPPRRVPAVGPAVGAVWSPCCRMPTARWTGSSSTATATATAGSSTSA